MEARVERAIAALLATPELASRRIAGVWVFGSHARGQARPDSDVDLAVLCDPALGVDRPTVIDRASAAAGIEIDVIDLASALPALAWEIVTTGQLIRELDEHAVERFVRDARYAAEDAWRRDRMIVLASAGTVGGFRR
jgi:uncharacterized protein